MDADLRRAIEWDIARLLVTYCRGFDEGRFDEVADLFAPDATWVRPGKPTLLGEQAIRAFCTGTPLSMRFRHASSNILVDVIDAGTATAASTFILFSGTPGQPDQPCALDKVAIVGDYRDRFVRLRGRWRIAHRETSYAFVARD